MKKILFIAALLLMPVVVKADAPVGTITVYSGSTIPSGYLIADGRSVLRSDYPALYRAIGTTYGSADSTHFNLPNMQGKTVVGIDSSDTSFDELGKTGGSKTVTLTAAQLPEHTHTFTGTTSNTGNESVTHTHTFTGSTDSADMLGSFTVLTTDTDTTSSGIFRKSTTSMTLAKPGSGTSLGVVTYTFNSTHTHTYSGTTSAESTYHTHSVTPTGTISNTGSGSAHNNLQPYIAMYYIIKVN